MYSAWGLASLLQYIVSNTIMTKASLDCSGAYVKIGWDIEYNNISHMSAVSSSVEPISYDGKTH